MSEKSYEVLRQAMATLGVKAVAGRLNLSESLVYKWAQEPSESEIERSGAKNPLDRLLELYQITQDHRLISWLCQQAGGCFVENPKAQTTDKMDPTVIQNTQVLIKEFSDMLGEISASMAEDNNIDREEALRIRSEWEELKRKAEMFVMSCESGRFGPPENSKKESRGKRKE